MSMIISTEKTFTITYAGFASSRGEQNKTSTHTGTLQLKGSFVVIREWEMSDMVNTKAKLKAIHIIPAGTILSIDWIETPVVKLIPHEPHRA